MPLRPNWNGHLRISLVSFGVRLYNATSSTSEVSFNQLHKACMSRIKYDLVCPQHGKVDRSEIVKGYQYEKGKYVLVNEQDLDKIKLETTKILELMQFVDPDELDEVYTSVPYYVTPDGPVSDPPYRVMHEAMAQAKKIGIGRVVLNGRERIFSLQVFGKGFRLTTLRYPEELRKPEPYFADISEGPVEADQVKMAKQLLENLSGPLNLTQFTDRYENALLKLVQEKLEGVEPEVVQEAQVAKTLNFMEALKKSLAGAQKKPPARSVRKTGAKRKAEGA